MFRFRRQIDVIFLKFYRDSLLCVVILGIAGAIRQSCERFDMEILKNMAMRRIRAASNPAAGRQGIELSACERRRRYKRGGVAVRVALRSAVLPVSFK